MSADLSLGQSEFWLPDEPSESCKKCQRQFSALRLKYECWSCQQLYCNKCTKFIQLHSSGQYKRVCEQCIVSIKSEKNPDSQFRSLDSYSQDSNNLQLKLDENILDLIHELQPLQNEALESPIQSFTTAFTHSLLTEYQEDLSWADTLIKTALEVVETVCPSVKFRNDSMNINKYLKIFQVPSEKNFCVFFQGSLIVNDVCSENLKETINSPTILFLDNRKNEGIEDGDMEIKRRDSEVGYFSLFENFKPDVVVATGEIEERMLEVMIQKGIRAVLNAEIGQFNHLARVTKGIALKSIREVAMLNEFLGRCSSIKTKFFMGKAYLCFLDVIDYTLGGSVIVGGKGTDAIRSIFKKMIVAFRNAKLERIFLFECGGRIDGVNLMDQFMENICVKCIQTCSQSTGNKIVQKCVKIYSSYDQSMGNFLRSLIFSSDETCMKCGNPQKSHKTHFFSNQFQVEASISDSKAINTSDFFLRTTCLTCHKSLPPHYLSNATWEYSFHKFLRNFFTQNPLQSPCTHPLFTQIFTFKLDFVQIVFHPKPFPNFSLLFSPISEQNSQFYNNLLQETLKDTQICSKYVLDQILASTKSIATKINQEMAAVTSIYDQLIVLRERALKIMEEIYTVMQDIFKPVSSNYVNFLDIESIRRVIFLECCRFQVEITKVFNGFQRILASDRGSQLIGFGELGNFVGDEDLAQYVQKLKGGNLTLPMCKACFVPVYEDDPGSLIAHALCSFRYYSEILEKSSNANEGLLEKEVLNWKFFVCCFEGMNIKEECKKIYGESCSFALKAYFAKHFHCLRTGRGINNDEFCLSICKTSLKKEDLGKSSAGFRQTHDARFIFKVVERKEIKMFVAMALEYFPYLHKCIFLGNQSVLNACLGLFKVQIKNFSSGKSKIQYLIVFDKVGYGLPAPQVVYDLKGTTNKRRRVKDGEKRTKMDLNFLEDFNSFPIPISTSEMNRLTTSITNDTSFLCKCNVIDYSILLFICSPERRISIGIIDYMQKYTFDKLLENKYKTVVGSQVPTIVSPENYKERFCETVLTQYFMVIDE